MVVSLFISYLIQNIHSDLRRKLNYRYIYWAMYVDYYYKKKKEKNTKRKEINRQIDRLLYSTDILILSLMFMRFDSYNFVFQTKTWRWKPKWECPCSEPGQWTGTWVWVFGSHKKTALTAVRITLGHGTGKDFSFLG